MNIAINDEILNNHGLSLSEFACILYYLDGNTDILNKNLCEKVWEKGFLIKIVDGFKIDNNKFSEIETMVAKATVVQSTGDRLLNLANALREVLGTDQKYKFIDVAEQIRTCNQVFYLGKGMSFNVSHIPGYQNLTADNFLVVANSITINGTFFNNGHDSSYYCGNASTYVVTKSYGLITT